MVKLVIAGSRNFNDYVRFVNEVNSFIFDEKIDNAEITILSGGAKGADQMAEKYANASNYALQVFYPDWDSYGRAAGPIRNAEMAANATHAIIFWDGVSRGSLSMIKEAQKKNLHYRIIRID